MIANPRSDGWWRDFHRTVAEKGIETRPYWTFCIGNDAREHVRNMANLLMQLPKGKLPDALLITDDNLAKSAFAGLEDSGSAAVQKLKIISHTNFPFTVNTRLPVTFLGYDSAQVVAACMRALARQRQGEAPAQVRENVIPVFDNELEGG